MFVSGNTSSPDPMDEVKRLHRLTMLKDFAKPSAINTAALLDRNHQPNLDDLAMVSVVLRSRRDVLQPDLNNNVTFMNRRAYWKKNYPAVRV
jgi:hypothetical protein